MKIGIVCANYPPAEKEGGISHYTGLIASHLESMGEEVFVATGSDYKGASKTVLALSDPWNRKTAKAIVENFKQQQVDVVNIQYSPAMYSQPFKAALSVITRAIPTIVSFHTLWGGEKINYLNALNLLRGADAVVATNSEVLYLIRRYLPFFSRKTYFIPIWLNILAEPTIDTLVDVAVRFGLKDKKYLLHFGMLYQGKGLEQILDAFGLLVREKGINCSLVIAGGGLSDAEKLRNSLPELIRKRKLDGRVIVTGRLDENEIASLFRNSTLALLPYDKGASDRRGSLMAALYYGKAIITSKPCVPIESFKNHENMVWPDSSSPVLLAEMIYSVYTDDEMRIKLESGARGLSSRFSWKNIASDMAVLFRKTVCDNNN